MLTRVTAIEHQAVVSSGKTGPSRIVCEKLDGSNVEVVAKFSAGCDQRELSLAREAIAARLAGALALPVPEPFLVDLPEEWSDLVSDLSQRAKIRASSRVAFGSRQITGGYSVWTEETRIDEDMLSTAASIFVFDAIIQNVDRRVENPNCFVKGKEIRIFDHELAFTHGLVIGWQPPWKLGGLKNLQEPGKHIFRQSLLGRDINYETLRAKWVGLRDSEIAEYGAELPREWSNAATGVGLALDLIRGARDNIDACLAEIKRVLT